MNAYYEHLSKMNTHFNPMTSASKVVSKVGSTRQGYERQLFFQLNAGHLRSHGVFACIDLQLESLTRSGDVNFDRASRTFELIGNIDSGQMFTLVNN